MGWWWLLWELSWPTEVCNAGGDWPGSNCMLLVQESLVTADVAWWLLVLGQSCSCIKDLIHQNFWGVLTLPRSAVTVVGTGNSGLKLLWKLLSVLASAGVLLILERNWCCFESFWSSVLLCCCASQKEDLWAVLAGRWCSCVLPYCISYQRKSCLCYKIQILGSCQQVHPV